MKLYFSISEFCIDKSAFLIQDVADKILKHHIWVMNPIREMFGAPIYVSKSSGYRPLLWELSKGRDGSSQHTFSGLGAVDYICNDLEKLLGLLIKHSSYTRIVYYRELGFIHCDYNSSVRQYFEVEKGKWVFKRNL